MVWWQWMVLGLGLLGAELMVDAQFYLVFLGVSAVAVGLVDVFWDESPVWFEWLLFSAFSIVTLLAFRGKLFQMLRGDSPDRGDGVLGESGTIEAPIEPGATGRMELRGTTWTARNAGESVLPRGSRARVESVSGLTVNVVPEDG